MVNPIFEGLEVWFRGDKVILTGEVTPMHGGSFCAGEYVEGHKNGEPVLIDEDYAKRYLPKTEEV